MKLTSAAIIGVAGAGAMGMGIAQVAAQAGHTVKLYDTRPEALSKSLNTLGATLLKLAEKGKITQSEVTSTLNRIQTVDTVNGFKDCDLIIEAIIEELFTKQSLFNEIESTVSDNCILATNTSSLSVTAIAGKAKKPSRFIGMHFFNPAPLMPLVEIIPAMQTEREVMNVCTALMISWKKIPVVARDTPGFIVNRVARPFYGEALRICEEQIADQQTIDQAMKQLGGFRMGPFELMDLIGNDINYAVTETVWTQCYFDPRYKPSIIQKRMVESGRLGRKSGQGYYNYADEASAPTAALDEERGRQILNRILVMLMNEAADALYYGIASADDIDLAMTKGVNYPKGLLRWADEFGIDNIIEQLDQLRSDYGEERYRASVKLRKMAANGKQFFS